MVWASAAAIAKTVRVSGPIPPPAAEIDITESLVRALLRSQHADLADEPLEVLANGWDNVIVRLGEELLVRLPRRELASQLMHNEQRWLPSLAPMLPLPISSPVRIGTPTAEYPWPWTISRWFPGRSALTEAPTDPLAAAQALGEFVAALHVPAPPEAPANPYRGIPLADRNELTLGWIDQLGSTVDGDQVRRCWAHHVALPRWSGPPLWLHGDLHPHNVVVHQGRVAAVIDFGDITSGDPATDLAIAWMLLPPAARPAFRDAARLPDEATWERGRGWALALGLAYLANSASTPDFAQLGMATISAVIADA